MRETLQKLQRHLVLTT